MRSDMEDLSLWVDAQTEQIEEINSLLDQAENLIQELPEEKMVRSGLPDWEKTHADVKRSGKP